MIEYLIKRGAPFHNVLDSKGNTILMKLVKQDYSKAINVLSGFRNIYCKNAAMKTALGIMTMRRRFEPIIQFCHYIITNNDQFGGEFKVCKYIVDNNASQTIFQLDEKDLTRKQFVRILRKYNIKIDGFGFEKGILTKSACGLCLLLAICLLYAWLYWISVSDNQTCHS